MSGLGYGPHTITLQASSGDDRWSTPYRLTFEIARPWQHSGSTWIAATLLLGAAVALVLRQRRR